MWTIKKAKHLRKQGFTNEEIANELNVDQESVTKLVAKPGFYRCIVCGGFFDYVLHPRRYCSFTCWASHQPDLGWEELHRLYDLDTNIFSV